MTKPCLISTPSAGAAASRGWSSIRALLALMGDPQKDMKFIHVTGTNGKGSTCAIMASILRAAGYRTGLYTSPFLIRFNERHGR